MLEAALNKLVIYTSPSAFPNPQRVRLPVHEKGIADQLEERVLDMAPVGEQRGWRRLARNPWGETPTLELPKGGYLAESVAVARCTARPPAETAADRTRDGDPHAAERPRLRPGRGLRRRPRLHVDGTADTVLSLQGLRCTNPASSPPPPVAVGLFLRQRSRCAVASREG